MKRNTLLLALGIFSLYFFQSCQKGIDSGSPNPGGGGPSSGASDSIYLPEAARWTNFGFGSPGTLSMGVLLSLFAARYVCLPILLKLTDTKLAGVKGILPR